MAEYRICEVQKNHYGNIEAVCASQLLPVGPSGQMGPVMRLLRSQVVDLIKAGHQVYTAFVTRGADGYDWWQQRARVVLFRDVYITTEGNHTTRDNLDELPPCTRC